MKKIMILIIMLLASTMVACNEKETNNAVTDNVQEQSDNNNSTSKTNQSVDKPISEDETDLVEEAEETVLEEDTDTADVTTSEEENDASNVNDAIEETDDNKDSDQSDAVEEADTNEASDQTDAVEEADANEASDQTDAVEETDENNNDKENDSSDASESTEASETTEESSDATESSESTEEVQIQYNYLPIDVTTLDQTNRPYVTIEMSDDQKIVINLVPEVAPNTVNSFLTLASEGYYDGLIFHRIIEGFMVQGGDPDGTGAGGPGYTLKDEFYIIDGVDITYLSHTKGIVSMAKTGAPDSAGSQFFIMHGDGTFLDGQYASFAYVSEGMDVVEALGITVTGANDRPVVDVVMKSITVNLNGYELIAPIVIK